MAEAAGGRTARSAGPLSGGDAGAPGARWLATDGPDAAFRARLNALVFDVLVFECAWIVGVLGLGLVLAIAGVRVSSLVGVVPAVVGSLAFVVALSLYMLWFEAKRGRTPGKRRYQLHVVALGGTPPTTRQIVLRNALRPVDYWLGALCAVGLLCILVTGPGRRQRLGDIVAGTTVVLDEGWRARPLRTPPWLLPMLAALALVSTTGLLLAAIAPGWAASPGRSLAFAPPRSKPTGPPRPGIWTAVNHPGEQLDSPPAIATAVPGRVWTIGRTCDRPSGCIFVLSELFDGVTQTAQLTDHSGTWTAAFQLRGRVCGHRAGTAIRGTVSVSWLFWFAHRGRTATAREDTMAATPPCPYTTGESVWTATTR